MLDNSCAADGMQATVGVRECAADGCGSPTGVVSLPPSVRRHIDSGDGELDDVVVPLLRC
jgi:hypothetical protein